MDWSSRTIRTTLIWMVRCLLTRLTTYFKVFFRVRFLILCLQLNLLWYVFFFLLDAHSIFLPPLWEEIWQTISSTIPGLLNRSSLSISHRWTVYFSFCTLWCCSFYQTSLTQIWTTLDGNVPRSIRPMCEVVIASKYFEDKACLKGK